MIYLFQSDREYDYDVRATALAFFEREKIIEITEEEWKKKRLLAEKEEEGSAIRFLSLVFEKEQKVRGLFADACGKEVLEEISCDYRNHENSRSIMGRFLYQLFSKYTGRTLPWGTLTGIRPSKIVMKWLEEGMEPEQILKRFQETYLADEQKAQLCLKVAQK